MINLFTSFKRFLPKGLFARATLIVILPVVLVQVIIAILFWDNHWGRVSSRLAKDLIGEVRYVLSEVNQAQTTQEIVYLQSQSRRYLDFSFSFDPNHILTKDDGTSDIASKTIRQQLTMQIPGEWSLKKDPNDLNFYILSIQSRNGVMHVKFRKSRIFSSSIFVVVIWGAIAATAFIMVAELFLRNQVRAIAKLAEVAEAYGKGRDIIGYKPYGAKEVRRVGASFLSMRRRLNSYIEQRTLMLSGISHDMRTPLTRLTLELDMMDPNDPAVIDMQQDVAQMQQMIKAWLSYIRDAEGEATQHFSLSKCLEDICAGLRKKYSNDAIVIQRYQPVIIEGKLNSLNRAFTNIIENAVKYGIKANITYFKEESFISVIVEDEGPGISPEEKANVFKPFYRIESSRNTQTGGIGLGLSIARDIITAHGGEIYLENRDVKGLRCRIILPI